MGRLKKGGEIWVAYDYFLVTNRPLSFDGIVCVLVVSLCIWTEVHIQLWKVKKKKKKVKMYLQRKKLSLLPSFVFHNKFIMK